MVIIVTHCSPSKKRSGLDQWFALDRLGAGARHHSAVDEAKWALPVMSVLAPTPETSKRLGAAPQDGGRARARTERCWPYDVGCPMLK
ncbi:MAG: hypothetical protein WKF84_28175 [Pyrinomonadaceae bacterium]